MKGDEKRKGLLGLLLFVECCAVEGFCMLMLFGCFGLLLAMRFNELEMKCTPLNRDVRIIVCQFRSTCECTFYEYKIDKKLKEVSRTYAKILREDLYSLCSSARRHPFQIHPYTTLSSPSFNGEVLAILLAKYRFRHTSLPPNLRAESIGFDSSRHLAWGLFFAGLPQLLLVDVGIGTGADVDARVRRGVRLV